MPLVVRGRWLGAITLATMPGRAYGESEARLAQDLARRAALALDASRRHGEARELLRLVGGELRPPLAALGRALRGAADPAATGAARTAVRALSAVAREARAAARLVAVAPDAADRRVDLAHVVDDALNAVASEARAKRVDVATTVEPVQVTGDRRRLRQAALRLLQTAVRTTPDGGRIRTRLKREGARAVLAVSVVGASLAQPTALRLAVARQLVEHDGGTLTMASEDASASTTYTLSLPLA
jgi:signal transduction histidine kinase